MDTVGSYEAKTHLPALLERVAKGEKIIITKHGNPVAMLVPVEPSGNLDRKSAIEAMLKFRKGLPSVSISEIREMIEEGRQ